MNRHILKHIHSNLYLVVLGIYNEEEAAARRLSMNGVLDALGAMQNKQLNLPIYLQPVYDKLPELRQGKSAVPEHMARPAGNVIRISNHLTTAMDFGSIAMVAVGLVRFFEPMHVLVERESWGFGIRGISKHFYSDHYQLPTKSIETITGWDVFEYVLPTRESLLLDRLRDSSLCEKIKRFYAFLSEIERHRDAVVRALRSVESVTAIEDVSYMRFDKMQYTFSFQMDLAKAELLYRVFPPYLQLRVANTNSFGNEREESQAMICFFDVGDEDDLQKLVQYSLPSFFNNQAPTEQSVKED